MSEHFFALTDRPPCDECQRPLEVRVRISTTGWSAGETIRHAPTCSKLRCRHGVPRADDCAACDADRPDEGDE